MRDEIITFKLATHFLPKIALRLQYLFLAIQEASIENHPIIHHYALKNLIDILKLIEKPELKSRFLKELVRIEHSVNKLSTKIPEGLYSKLYLQIQKLNEIVGRFGDSIHYDPFLQTIRILQIGEQDCEINSPPLLFWLRSDAKKRQIDLQTWLKPLEVLSDTVTIYLSILKNCAKCETLKMPHGFYQRTLPAKSSCHMIFLSMHKDIALIPQMQLGNHGLSVRFYDAKSMHEVKNIDIAIDLAFCYL